MLREQREEREKRSNCFVHPKGGRRGRDSRSLPFLDCVSEEEEGKREIGSNKKEKKEISC